MKQNKALVLLILGLWPILGMTCTDDDGNCTDYGSCERSQGRILCPMAVALALDSLNPCVDVDFYADKITPGNFIRRDRLCSSEATYKYNCGQTFALRAQYKYASKSGQIITVEANDEVELTAHSSTNCEKESCYSTPWTTESVDLKPNYGLLPDSVR